jgi:hypothetical protein
MTAHIQSGLYGPRGAWRILLLCTLCAVVFAQPETKQLAIYAPQVSYSVPVVERGALEYVDLVAVLEPLANVSTRTDGKKLKLSFAKTQGEFTRDKTMAKLAGEWIDLTAPLRIENNRGLVPLVAVPQIISSLTGMTPDYHASARRLLFNGVATHYTVEAKDPARLVFTFSSPVNPMIDTEPGRLRMSFHREPLLGGAPANYNGKQITFTEQNGAAQIDVSTSTPLIAGRNRARRSGSTATAT